MKEIDRDRRVVVAKLGPASLDKEVADEKTADLILAIEEKIKTAARAGNLKLNMV